ncbi:MAG TPA: DUF1385 domain-containing protein [Candidatus Nanoarchaeia archaeon]|nr:DUF1385 domain-containing protein [Candidatus Nanoarchaeia archaeon]
MAKHNKADARPEIYTAGGQAVIEGVLIRAKNSLAIAVRKPNGKIAIKKEALNPLALRYYALGLPIIRGTVNLIEMLSIGFKAMTYSANQAGGEEGELSMTELVVTIGLSLLIAIALFKLLPLFITNYAYRYFSGLSSGYYLYNILDGTIKILLFIAYVSLIGRMKDVKRLFMYHGAEHQAVHCYEAGKPLTVKNVQKYRPEHPRCGTSFIIIVLITSIIIYTFIPQETLFWNKLLLRLALLPVIAGIAYEILRFAGKHYDTRIMRMVSLPGVLMQKITTKKPDRKQIEVALAALNAVLAMEARKR